MFAWFLALFACLGSAIEPSPDFPIVDLGYAKHALTKVNTTSLNKIKYATYSNIRFAQPPIGDLRFRGPQTPPPTSEEVQDGVVPLNSTNCLQSIPDYFTALPGLEGTSWGSEDCLFLDVIVPEGIKAGRPVPVLHWIYGGGFFFGAKDTGGNPAALFDRMTKDELFVIVASNYRLGALGWLSSEGEPMTPNAGLYDSFAALQWTQEYVHLFGGDKNRVTVMGQSAGAGQIEHFLAADADGYHIPFQQAILSSPGYRPHINRSVEMTELYQMVLELTDCTTVRCLRDSPSEKLANANRDLYLKAPTDGFPGPSISFGPILDQHLVKRLPELALAGPRRLPRTSKVKRVIAGGLKNEGAASTIGDFTSWKDLLSIFCRTPTSSTTQEVKFLYGKFDGSRSSFTPNGDIGFETPFDEFSGGIIYECHALYACQAYSGVKAAASSAYRYEMSILPALHGQDLNYYFYDEIIAAADPTVDLSIAYKLQAYFRDFILGKELDGWPEYSSKGLDNPSWVNITANGFESVAGKDETDLSRKCGSIVSILQDNKDGW